MSLLLMKVTTMRRYLLLIPTILLLVLPIQAQTSLEERGFGAYVPSTYTAESDPLSLVIALHGFGDTYENFALGTGWLEAAETENFVAAFPQGHLRQWNDGSRGEHYEDDVAIILDLIELIAAEINIDRDRIYLVGFSNGGTMVYRAACETSGIFAGVAAVGGTMRLDQDCDESAATSMVILHGTADDVVPYTGSASNRRYDVRDATAIWRDINNCTDEAPDLFELGFENDLAVQRYQDCDDGKQVMLYLVDGLPHTWMGSYERFYNQPVRPAYDATSVIWAFFEAAHRTERLAEQNAAVESTEEP